MSVQEAGHVALSWTVSLVGGVLLTAAWESYKIIAVVSESSWDKLAEQVPQMVVMLICFSMFLRAMGKLGERIDNVATVFGAKIDNVEIAVSQLRETSGINAEAAKSHCRWMPPTQSWEARHDIPHPEDPNSPRHEG